MRNNYISICNVLTVFLLNITAFAVLHEKDVIKAVRDVIFKNLYSSTTSTCNMVQMKPLYPI